VSVITFVFWVKGIAVAVFVLKLISTTTRSAVAASSSVQYAMIVWPSLGRGAPFRLK
jgi:hypothetical protein